MQQISITLFVIFICIAFADKQCTYLASDGSFYDLSALEKTSDFITSDSYDRVYYFSICRKAYTCTDGAACDRTNLGDETTLGLVEKQSFSEKHVKDGQGVSIVYNGGFNCEGVENAGDFVVTLKCDESVEFLLSELKSECSESRAIMFSKYACPIHKVDQSVIPDRRSQEVVDEIVDQEVTSGFDLIYLTAAITSATVGLVLVVTIVVVTIIFILRKESNDEGYVPLSGDNSK